MAQLRWLSAGLFAAAAIAVLVIGLAGSGEAFEPDPRREVSISTAGSAPTHVHSSPEPSLVARDAAPGTDDGIIRTDTTSPADIGSASSVTVPAVELSVSPQQTPQSPPADTSIGLRIPALEVDATVAPLGFDGAGGFAVPSTAAGVGWYEFSAWPGAPGNTVLGGHLNWRGSRGVFDRLDELSPGDMVYVQTADGELAYRVVGLHSVTADTPFVEILGERSGPSTLTLFTCGGTFSTAAGEYDQRVVVTAVLI